MSKCRGAWDRGLDGIDLTTSLSILTRSPPSPTGPPSRVILFRWPFWLKPQLEPRFSVFALMSFCLGILACLSRSFGYAFRCFPVSILSAVFGTHAVPPLFPYVGSGLSPSRRVSPSLWPPFVGAVLVGMAPIPLTPGPLARGRGHPRSDGPF